MYYTIRGWFPFRLLIDLGTKEFGASSFFVFLYYVAFCEHHVYIDIQ